ncbi:MAG: putative RND superfamily exporter protein [Bacteriovoracaceae bacterium]|jgi:predicted RND superfamily exporter protein
MNHLFKRASIIILGIAFILLSLYFAATTLPFRITELLEKNNQTRIDFEKYNKSFNDEFDFTILINQEKPFSPIKIVEVLTRLHNRFDHDLTIREFKSLRNAEFLNIEKDYIKLIPFISRLSGLHKNFDEEMEKKFIRNSFLSSDKTSIIISAQFSKTHNIKVERKNIKLILQALIDIEKSLPGIKIHPIGTKVAQYYYYLETIRNQNILTPVLLICLGALIYFLFRSFKILWVFLFIILLSYASVIYLIALNEGGISSYSGFAMFFILVVATSDLVHFFSVFLNNKGSSTEQALASVKHEIFKPCLLTSITTAICFISLIPNSIIPVSNIGIYASFGSISCFVITFYFLPFLIRTFGIKPEIELNLPGLKVRTLIEKVLIAPKKTLLIFTGIAIFFIYYSFGLSIDDDFYTKFSDKHPLTKAVSLFQSKFNSIGSLDLSYEIKSNNKPTDPSVHSQVLEFEKHITSLPQVAYIKSYNGLYQYIRDAYNHLPKNQVTEKRIQSLTQMMKSRGIFSGFYNSEFETYRSIIFLKTTSSKETQAVVNKINNLAKKFHLSFNAKPRGFVTLRTFVFDKLTKNFLISFGFSLLSIFILFLIIYRSFTWALIGMLPNIIPLLFIGGLLGFLNMPMDSNLVLMICITLGIAVDDTIHFLWALKLKLKEELPLKEAILGAFDKTSKALFGTTLIFTLSFPCFFFADLKIFSQVGTFVILSLIFALAADFLLLPALLVSFSKNKKI